MHNIVIDMRIVWGTVGADMNIGGGMCNVCIIITALILTMCIGTLSRLLSRYGFPQDCLELHFDAFEFIFPPVELRTPAPPPPND